MSNTYLKKMMNHVNKQSGIYKVIQESRSDDCRGEGKIFSDLRLRVIRIRYRQ